MAREAHWNRFAALFLGTTVLLLFLPGTAAARTLHWSAIDVEASLDADGRLHVSERQAMVFSGAWNGGERVFRLTGDQTLDLRGMRRIAPDGDEIEMRRGSLDGVDEYRFTDRQTLRWRSRLPDDPPFYNTQIVYVLEYTLSNVLLSTGGNRYRLDHDFAFSDRAGPIERFGLRLEIDPAWNAPAVADGAVRVDLEELPRGRGVVRSFDLEYVGDGRPAGISRVLPFWLRFMVLIGSLGALGALWSRFLRFEREQGRFGRARLPATLDADWLERHLFYLRAEEAGALWDHSIGAPEVAALIARLVGEGKLESTVSGQGKSSRKQKMSLRLAAARDDFEDYERDLIDKLFFDGREETDTDALKEHYKSTGFSPAREMRPGLKKRLKRVPGFDEIVAPPPKRPTALLFGGVLLCVALEALTRGRLVAALATSIIGPVVLPAAIGYYLAYRHRRKAERSVASAVVTLIPLAFILLGLLAPMVAGTHVSGGGAPVTMSLFGLLAPALLALMFGNSLLNMARTRDTEPAVRVRKMLAGIRRFFEHELQQPRPDLQDAWFPYLLAFGLAKDVDKWSVAYAAAGAGSAIASTSAGSSSWSGQGRGAGWTGGGGSFGGAGASASFAAAAVGLAAGVASPSSGGGGGGGGGGGSSGGGGGGGW